jgi:hypothetical protein
LLGLVADHDALAGDDKGQPAITISAPDIVFLDCKGNNFTAKGVVGTSFSLVFPLAATGTADIVCIVKNCIFEEERASLVQMVLNQEQAAAMPFFFNNVKLSKNGFSNGLYIFSRRCKNTRRLNPLLASACG